VVRRRGYRLRVAARTHYEIMMLHPSATPEVITAVYRQLAKQHHPDHAGPEGERRMAEINEAFAILGNAEKRSRYDEIIGLTTASTPSPVASTPSGTRTTSAASSASASTSPSPSASSSGAASAFSRASAPGATNLKYEGGTWAVRDPFEATPPPAPYGEAGPPPRHLPSRGRTISFGRYRGWTVDQVASYDRNYIEWLSRTMAGRTYQADLERVLSPAR
jgi:curved DNA-binding protein CbpA